MFVKIRRNWRIICHNRFISRIIRSFSDSARKKQLVIIKIIVVSTGEKRWA